MMRKRQILHILVKRDLPVRLLHTNLPPLFQLLSRKKSLGVVHVIYPSHHLRQSRPNHRCVLKELLLQCLHRLSSTLTKLPVHRSRTVIQLRTRLRNQHISEGNHLVQDHLLLRPYHFVYLNQPNSIHQIQLNYLNRNQVRISQQVQRDHY